MSRLSFVTVALYLKWMEEHSFLPDEDQLAKTYDSLFQELKKAGYQWVDLSSWELDVLGINRMLVFLQNYGLKTSSYIHFEDYAELEKDGYQGRLSVEFFPDEDLTLTDSIVRSKAYLEKFL